MAKIEGVAQTITNLQRISDKALDRLVNVVESQQAEVVNTARYLVPVDTGALRESIAPGGIVVSHGNVEAKVEANQDYASFVEYGTSKQKPQPYLVPSLEARMSYFRRAVQAALNF